MIATNYHVIEDAETVSVSFIDGNSYEATVNGYDEDRDLAVVSVSLDDISDDTLDEISVAAIGSSDDLQVGEQVVAIGNALGYGQSVTTGIVSAKNRRLDGSVQDFDSDNADEADGVNLIQTDAAINPGNSGGALLNMDGEVVGINSAKLASTEVEGMGYAIAISDVADVLENLMNETPREKVEDGNHGVLGITGTSVSDEAVQVYGMPAGVYVTEITEDSGADEAGIKKNTIITEFNGKRVKDIQTLVDLLEYYEPGEEVELTVEVIDGDGYKEKTVTVTLSENTNKDEDKEDQEDKKNNEKEDQSEESEGNLYEDWENSEEEKEQIPDIREFFGQW
ncbi:MAG: trypsin-like peptidase domain-containing protein [Eubacteriales bacterium]|nr:trypsin-like peptidase domain-containing protein [Eubacteriales bacterium]